MKDITKIIKLLEESGSLIQGISERIKNETKGQKGGYLSVLLASSLLGSKLTGRGVIRAGEGTVRACKNL